MIVQEWWVEYDPPGGMKKAPGQVDLGPLFLKSSAAGGDPALPRCEGNGY
jgi:hypothetical protein